MPFHLRQMRCTRVHISFVHAPTISLFKFKFCHKYELTTKNMLLFCFFSTCILVAGSNVLTWSYEANPACNVLVGENSEVTAAKSTILETNKSSSSRPKTSTASTTSSSSTNSQPSSNASSGGTGGGKDPSNHHKRYRRSVPSLRLINVGTRTGLLRSVHATVKQSSSLNDINLLKVSSSTADRYVISLSSPSPPTNMLSNELNSDTSSSSSHSSSTTTSQYPLSASIFNGRPLAISKTFSNYKLNNVAQIDEGESSGDGNTNDNQTNELHASLSLANALSHDSYIIGNDAFDLITDSFDESSALDIINNNNENNDASIDRNAHQPNGDANDLRPEEMLQNDGPTIITHDNQPSVAIVNLDNDEPLILQSNRPHRPLSAATSTSTLQTSKDDDVIQSHKPAAAQPTRIPSKHKPALSADIENDIDKYSYVETAYPEPTYYQMHDSNNNSINLHDQQTQRILVNVSIATDSGSGTQNHGVYMLHVSVPAGPDFLPPHINAPIVHVQDASGSTHEALQQKNDDVRDCPPKIPPQPPCPCQCAEEFFSTSNASTASPSLNSSSATTAASPAAPLVVTNGTDGEDGNDAYAQPSTLVSDATDQMADATTTVNPISSTTPYTETRSCLEIQDIPTILILEGERVAIR